MPVIEVVVQRLAIVALLAALTGCAETDPYRRLDPAPTNDSSTTGAAMAFNARWPAQFKCVQTVTVDFGVTSRALVGYLIVQQPGKFRLQGMTEHGIKLLEIVGNQTGDHTLLAADEFDPKVVKSIARDLRRIFLDRIDHGGVHLGNGYWNGDMGDFFERSTIRTGESGDVLKYERGQRELVVKLVGEKSLVDSFALKDGVHAVYRVDQYEWRDFEYDWPLPSVIVLRQRGTDGPAYKLTIHITELHVRDEPWSGSVFTEGE
jgi:hypothetical protein